MEYHVWSSRKKTCDCCGLTLREIQKQNDKAREKLLQKEKEWNFWVALLYTFEADIDGAGYWYGPVCRRCSGAPQSVGEMFLAKFSEGWLCNKCYARKPEDTKGQWKYMPVPVDEDEELI